MPGKADYWKYFIVQEMLAVCQIAGCTKPNVSLGPLPKAGEKKRISKYSLLLMYIFNCFLSATGAVTNHLMKNHKQEWDAYCQMRARTNAKVLEAKEEKKEACEMENGTLNKHFSNPQTWGTSCVNLHSYHCSNVGPHLGTFFSFWVPKRSPLSSQGTHFPAFRLKNAPKVTAAIVY